MSSELRTFLYPSSICLAGASTKEKSIGFELLQTILSFGYKGRIFPVNPKADSILGLHCYKAVSDIKEKIDLGIIVVPKRFADDTMDEMLNKGVKSIILITAGFKETGQEGEIAEKVLLKNIKKHGARLIGPNCMGLINTNESVKLNATFVAEKPGKGSIGFLSQSGALGAAVLNSLRETDIKFSHFISVGNKADVNENDVLEFWQNDENIEVIALYLESFENGEIFIDLFSNRKVTKPVIILKAGRTESGMKAASSHTGALSSSDKIIDAILEQFGIIRADNLSELFNTSRGFENFPSPKGKNVAVVTNAGGPAILAVDKLEKEGLKLAELSLETRTKLRDIVHVEGSVNNPVDLLPGGTGRDYKNVCEILIKDENVDSIISIFVEPVMVEAFSVVESINSLMSDKPILQVCMPLPEFWEEYRKNSKSNLPVFRNPEDPAEVIANMLFYVNSRKKLDRNIRISTLTKVGLKKSAHGGISEFLSETEVEKICKENNIPIVRGIFIKGNDISNIENLSFPVVLKGISKNVIHKTEMNAVKLNIKNKDVLMAEAEDILSRFSNEGYKLDGFLIQPFLQVKHELLIGGFRDPSFGPVIMFGAGGKYVEVWDDTFIKSAQITDEDIFEMISETKIGKILMGTRGEYSIDLNTLKQLIMNCSKMMLENSQITEFDINPLIVNNNNRLYAADVRIKIN